MPIQLANPSDWIITSGFITHNGRDSVSNHQPHDFFTQRFIQAQIKESIKAPRHWPVNSPHKWLVTRKMFPFDDVIMHRSLMMTYELINSLASERCGVYFKCMTLKLNVQNSSLDTCHETDLMRMLQKLTKEKSTLARVMAWCLHATSHYLGQCWPRSKWPWGVIMSQDQKKPLSRKLNFAWFVRLNLIFQ